MKYIVAVLIALLSTYLVGSFVNWTFNAGAWGWDTRMGFACIGFIACFPALGIASEIKKK